MIVTSPLRRAHACYLHYGAAGEHPKTIERVLATLGVHLKPSTYSMDTQPLLKEACSSVFGTASGLVDMLVAHIPSSKKATAKKVQQDFTGVYGQGAR